jgi:type II secretory pathway component PulM
MTRERARWIVLGSGLFIFAAGTWAWFSRGQERIESENRKLVEHEGQIQGRITVLEKELATAEAKASATLKPEQMGPSGTTLIGTTSA